MPIVYQKLYTDNIKAFSLDKRGINIRVSNSSDIMLAPDKAVVVISACLAAGTS